MNCFLNYDLQTGVVYSSRFISIFISLKSDSIGVELQLHFNAQYSIS